MVNLANLFLGRCFQFLMVVMCLFSGFSLVFSLFEYITLLLSLKAFAGC